MNTYREKIRMPRAARSTSSRGGRTPTDLALTGLATRQTGSSTLGSSTQNQSIGSSTQNQLIGSSTQKLQKQTSKSPIETSKQTKSDYAIPIHTLLAFQEQGLVSLPNKTWADIADEEEEQESLELIIKNLKNKSVQINPKPINQADQGTSHTQFHNNQNPQFQYISKPKFIDVIQMEPEFWDNNPYKVPSKIFPSGFHFQPLAYNKTQQFYEFILVDSDSISIKHYKDAKDASNITHSTIQILKVLTPSSYGQNPNKTKKFSQAYDPIGYNYWDYIQAWTYIFWKQNKVNKHSWLIYFKTGVNYTFPNWFLQWWDYFGPIHQILPSEVQEGFQVFNKRFNKDIDNLPIELSFFSRMSLTWIFSWQYKYGQNSNTNVLPILQKQAFVKWWPRFDFSNATAENVTIWFKNNPNYLQVADPETCRFLNQKSRITAALAAASSEDDFVDSLEDVLALIKKEKGKQNQDLPSSSSSMADSLPNEEDCYAIYSPINLADD